MGHGVWREMTVREKLLENLAEIEKTVKESEPVVIEKSNKPKLVIKKPVKKVAAEPLAGALPAAVVTEQPATIQVANPITEVQKIVPTGQPMKLRIRAPPSKP